MMIAGRGFVSAWRCIALLARIRLRSERGRSGQAADEPIEIFDAHMHYNWEPKPFYSVDEVLALFKKHRVTGILATSRPNTGTHALMEAKPQGLQIVPFIRPYRVRADIQTWFGDPFIFDLVQDEFKRGYYRGIGEFHISGKAAEGEWVKKTVDFAVANDLYLHAHADDIAVEILMRHNPRARIIWAHTGFGLPTERVAEMLAKYPKLWGELSYRSGIADGGGKLTAEWRALFERHPDRFLLGSDTWVNQRWESYGEIMAGYRAWLGTVAAKDRGADCAWQCAGVVRRGTVAWPGLRSRYESTGAFDPFKLARRVHGFPQVAAALHVQPEVGAVTEHSGKDERCRCGHSPAVVAQFVDVLALHAHGLGQRALRQAHRLHEFLDQDFADARRPAFRRQHRSPHL